DWYPTWAPGLDYYAQVTIARLVPKSCRVESSCAGLGDDIAPPCGVAMMFNNLACPKKIVWVQGSTHGYVPPCPQRVIWR
ncbi:MAG: acetylxylan esterase, partial [Kiritimatiellae bacterium]|nr:acetylxylan esterase [Kiritimatiellia bacterium]